MVIEFQASATPRDLARIAERLTHPLRACNQLVVDGRRFLVISGLREDLDVNAIIRDPVVRSTSTTDATTYFCRREFRPNSTTPIRFGNVTLGTGDLVLIAGVCSIESEDDLMATAQAVKRAGAHGLRGGAFKPRTSPYNFQGLGMRGLELLAEAGRAYNLPVVSEVLDPCQIEPACEHLDMIQVGTRNMTNQALLKYLGRAAKPVLLKRGFASRLEELVRAAEFVTVAGNPNVALCERGIQTFETSTRYTLDVAAIPVLRRATHLPLVVDPSHAPGRRDLVPDLALAAAVVGADALLVEVHVRPERLLKPGDGAQALRPDDLADLVDKLHRVLGALGRRLHPNCDT